MTRRVLDFMDFMNSKVCCGACCPASAVLQCILSQSGTVLQVLFTRVRHDKVLRSRLPVMVHVSARLCGLLL